MFIASCPECGDSLTFPSGVALSSKCRCPLCTETFTLEDCLSELPPMAVILEGGDAGSGLSPAYGGGVALASAPRTATPSRAGSTATGPRTAARAPARKARGGNPILQLAQVVVGGMVGVSLAVLIIWWVIGTDPFGLAPTVAAYAPFLVPEKFRTDALPEESQGSTAATTNDGKAPAPRNSRRPQQGIQLDGSRFATEEERSKPSNDDVELAPVESGDDLFAPGAGAFSAPFEEPKLEEFAPRGIDLDPAELSPDPSVGAEPSEPSLDPALTAPTAEPAPGDLTLDPAPGDLALSDPAVEAPAESALGPRPGERPLDEPMEETAEPGAFQLKPLVDPSDDPTAADPATTDAGDPFSLVFPTATEDLPGIASGEVEAWETLSAAKEAKAPGAELRKVAGAHYEQLASIAQTLAGLPPAPRSSAVVAETTQKLADRFDEAAEQQVLNFLARERFKTVDFDMAGAVVVGRVTDVKTEGELAVVTLSLEQVKDEAARRVVALVRESQGVPAQDAVVVAMGVKHPSDTSNLPASLAEEKAPILLAGAIAEVGAPAAEAPASEESPAPEPAPTEPAPETTPEPTPTEPSTEEPAPTEPAPTEEPAADPASAEPASEEPAPEAPAPAEEAPAPSEPSGEAPAEEPAPAEAEQAP